MNGWLLVISAVFVACVIAGISLVVTLIRGKD
jgi:hypothetical protein